MDKIEDLWTQIKKVVPITKTSVSLILICLAVLIWGSVRACSNPRGIDTTRLFRIARDPSWYPLNLMGKDKNLLAFSNDLLLTISKRKKVNIELISVSSSALFEGLDDKKYQAVISSMMPTAISNLTYNFSDPFYLVGPVLIVPKNSKVKSLADLDGKDVAIRREAKISIDLTKYQIYYKPYESMTIAFDDLLNNHIDGIILPAMQAYLYTETFHQGKFKVITSPLNDEGLRIIALATPESTYLIEQFNTGLQEMIKDGTYAELLKKWGLVNPIINRNIEQKK